MFMTLTPSRKDRRRIKALKKWIDETIQAEVEGATTSRDKQDAFSLAMSMSEEERNELEHLRQKPFVNLLRKEGMRIPKEYWQDTWYFEETLTSEGEDWARLEAKKLWRTNVEFWVKLVMPVLALVLSIIALVRKSH